MRRILVALSPPDLSCGLAAALGALSNAVFGTTGVHVTVSASDDADLRDDVAMCVYVVAREALINARRHANPASVTVDLATSDEAAVLRVCDDGVGIAPGHRHHPSRLGLTSMSLRADATGGKLRLESSQSAGTTVVLTIPRPRKSE